MEGQAIKEENVNKVEKNNVKEENMNEVETNNLKEENMNEVEKHTVKEENMNDVEKHCIKEENVNEVERNSVSDEKNHDLYSYTKLNDFTSEIFKIEVGNLPNYVGYGQLRKLLNGKLKLDPHKIKAIGSPPNFAFITFKNEEDRDKALKCLDGYPWKGKNLSAKKANPMADPLVKKRQAGDSEDSPSVKKIKIEDDIPIALRLKNVVTPLWNVSYEEQLKKKETDVHKFLIKLGKEIEKVNRTLKSRLEENRKENHYQCCPMAPIKASPSTVAYRNKCEFSIGRDLNTKLKTVGFRLNRYKEGSMCVAEPDDCVNISQDMLKAVKSFEGYVRTSDKDVYNPETHEGYWRQLTVRTSKNADVMLIVVMHPQQLSEQDLENEKNQLKEYFESGLGASCGVTSVYFQTFDKKQSGQEDSSNLVHLLGKKCIEETIFDMKFEVSPEAFFQINASAAEVLYSVIAEKVGVESASNVLDICCGTGTIGLFLAKQGAKVIGVEMCPQAVENAKRNAEINNITTAEFVCGKAEDVIFTAINKIENSEVIAVVNPPRAGLHQKVIKVIRANKHLKKLVYVSCNVNAAFQNFVDLCRPPSNNYKGSPFFPVQASPIDMFPHTPHFELVLVFDRTDTS